MTERNLEVYLGKCNLELQKLFREMDQYISALPTVVAHYYEGNTSKGWRVYFQTNIGSHYSEYQQDGPVIILNTLLKNTAMGSPNPQCLSGLSLSKISFFVLFSGIILFRTTFCGKIG